MYGHTTIWQQTWQLWNHAYLSSHGFCGSGVWAYLGLLLHQAAIKVPGGALPPSSHGYWQDSGSGSLLDGGPQFPAGCWQKPPIVPYYVGLPDMAIFFFKASKGASPSKVNVRILWHVIMEVTACRLCNKLLARSKSQIPLSFRERGLYKDMDTKRLGSLVCVCHRGSISSNFF